MLRNGVYLDWSDTTDLERKREARRLRSFLLHHQFVSAQSEIGDAPEIQELVLEAPMNFLLDFQEPEQGFTPPEPHSISELSEDWRSKTIEEGNQMILMEEWTGLRNELENYPDLIDHLKPFPREKLIWQRGERVSGAPWTPWTYLFVDQQEWELQVVQKLIREKNIAWLAHRVVKFPELRELVKNLPIVKIDQEIAKQPTVYLNEKATPWQRAHVTSRQELLATIDGHLERGKWLGIRFILLVYPEIRELRPDLPFDLIDSAHSDEWRAARENPLTDDECAELGEGLSDTWKRVMKEGYWDRGIRTTYAECEAFWKSEVELGEIETKAKVDVLRERMKAAGIKSFFDVKLD